MAAISKMAFNTPRASTASLWFSKGGTAEEIMTEKNSKLDSSKKITRWKKIALVCLTISFLFYTLFYNY